MKEIIVLIRDVPEEQQSVLRSMYREEVSATLLHPVMDPLRSRGFSKSEIKIVDNDEDLHHILCNTNESVLK